MQLTDPGLSLVRGKQCGITPDKTFNWVPKYSRIIERVNIELQADYEYRWAEHAFMIGEGYVKQRYIVNILK